MGEFNLAEQTHAAVREVRWQAAVLPFGATEPHNLHMPYGTDTLQVEELGRRGRAPARGKGGEGGLLPGRAQGGEGGPAAGAALRGEHQPPEGAGGAGVQRDADDAAGGPGRPGRVAVAAG